jgi:hypothetical protein
MAMTRVLDKMAWSFFWTWRPLIPDIQISMTGRTTELQVTYERKASGSLNNSVCKPIDESKRSSALGIEGSSSTRQIMPAAGGKTADELTSIFLGVKRQYDW